MKGMKKEELTYEQAMERLEQIVSRIEHNELGVDHLGEELKQAQKLIKFCKDKLYETDENVRKLLGEENTDS